MHKTVRVKFKTNFRLSTFDYAEVHNMSDHRPVVFRVLKPGLHLERQ